MKLKNKNINIRMIVDIVKAIIMILYGILLLAFSLVVREQESKSLLNYLIASFFLFMAVLEAMIGLLAKEKKILLVPAVLCASGISIILAEPYIYNFLGIFILSFCYAFSCFVIIREILFIKNKDATWKKIISFIPSGILLILSITASIFINDHANQVSFYLILLLGMVIACYGAFSLFMVKNKVDEKEDKIFQEKMMSKVKKEEINEKARIIPLEELKKEMKDNERN